MPDDGLDGLTAFEQFAFLGAQRFELATVLDGGGYADLHTEFIRGFAFAFARSLCTAQLNLRH